MNLKKVIAVFILGFGLNVIWENLHSNLYIHYKSGEITELILLRAALFDAIFITLTLWIVYKISILKNKLFWIIVISFIGAIFIELYALNTNRWAYGLNMPLIPILNIGLTPTIQLALLSAIIYKITKKYT